MHYLNFIMFDRKVWVQNCKPYSISLTLKKLQEILNHDMPMDIDTFNLVVPKHMLDDIQMVKNQRGMISKHYLDLQFWVCSYSVCIYIYVLFITFINTYFIL